MKINCYRRGGKWSTRGFTLPEMLISVTIFGMLVLGLIAVNLFGMRRDELVNSKLGVNESSRLAFDLMLNEIRGAKSVQIGSGWYTNFVAISSGSQQGNCIQIALCTNTYPRIYYYIDKNPVDVNYNCLVRVSASTNGVTTNLSYVMNVICNNLTNLPPQWATNGSMFQGGTNALLFQAYDYSAGISKVSKVAPWTKKSAMPV